MLALFIKRLRYHLKLTSANEEQSSFNEKKVAELIESIDIFGAERVAMSMSPPFPMWGVCYKIEKSDVRKSLKIA